MKANYQKQSSVQHEVALSNLYDMNKQMMLQEEPLTGDEIHTIVEELKEWFSTCYNEKYFMLLCHDRRDYTLFNLDKTSSWKVAPTSVISDSALDVTRCLTNRGTLLSLELQPDGVWEAWIRIEDECFAYYLFPYGEAVIEY